MYSNRSVCFFVVFAFFLALAMVMTLTPVPLDLNQRTETFVFAQDGNNLTLAGLISQGSPYYGNKSAPIVIVDFSDFQCHLCKRHVDNTEQQINSTMFKQARQSMCLSTYQIGGLTPNLRHWQPNA